MVGSRVVGEADYNISNLGRVKELSLLDLAVSTHTFPLGADALVFLVGVTIFPR
jgi:hypothetical protein